MRKPGHPEGELPAQALAGTTLDHPLPHQLPAFKTPHPGQLRSLGGGGKGLTLPGRQILYQLSYERSFVLLLLNLFLSILCF